MTPRFSLPVGCFSRIPGLMLPALLLPLAGCATAQEAAVSPPDSFCAVARIIRPSPADTDATLRQVLAHNEKVRRFCRRRQTEGAR